MIDPINGPSAMPMPTLAFSSAMADWYSALLNQVASSEKLPMVMNASPTPCNDRMITKEMEKIYTSVT